MSIFRERQLVQKKKRWVSRLRQLERILISLAVVLAGLAALYGMYIMICFGDAFDIRKIEVKGSWKYLSADDLVRDAGVSNGDSLFWVSMSGIHENLEKNPWVRATVVRRELPDTLWIYVEEYRPKAIVQADGFFYVDAEGELFKVPESGDDRNFPVLSGLEVMEERKLDDDNGRRLAAMLDMIDEFENSELGRELDVAEIIYDDEKGFSMVTTKRPMQIYFGHAVYGDAMKMIDEMMDDITARSSRIRYILANEPERLIVKYQTS